MTMLRFPDPQSDTQLGEPPAPPVPQGTLGRLREIGTTLFPDRGWKSALRRLSFMLLALPRLGRIGRWLRCSDNPLLCEEMRSSPLVFHAIHRPYVNRKWRLGERLEAIEQHYHALLGRGAFLNIAASQYFDLLQFGPGYLNLRVVVDRPKWMRGEGEVAISLFHRDHRVYSAMFLIAGEPPDRLVVGAFQGWNHPEARDTYVALTHALHGMRPRDFLLNILKLVAAALGCREIWGVADACHRSEHALVRAGAKKFGYDEVWKEHGGELNRQGFFVIPAELKLRAPGEIPARKRAQYRRRYALLAEISQSIEEAFAKGDRRLREHAPRWLGKLTPIQETPADLTPPLPAPATLGSDLE